MSTKTICQPKTNQGSYPCPLCLQAGKPENVARSHNYANCQSPQPRALPRRPSNRSAMRLIMVPDDQPNQEYYSPGHTEQTHDWSTYNLPPQQMVHFDQFLQVPTTQEIPAAAYGPPPASFGLPDGANNTWDDPSSW